MAKNIIGSTENKTKKRSNPTISSHEKLHFLRMERQSYPLGSRLQSCETDSFILVARYQKYERTRNKTSLSGVHLFGSPRKFGVRRRFSAGCCVARGPTVREQLIRAAQLSEFETAWPGSSRMPTAAWLGRRASGLHVHRLVLDRTRHFTARAMAHSSTAVRGASIRQTTCLLTLTLRVTTGNSSI